MATATAVRVQVDGVMVAAVAAVVVGLYLYSKRAALADAINPTSPDNVAYKGVKAAVGDQRFFSLTDYYGATLDLLNPFNKSDAYAKQVFGLPSIYGLP